MPNTILTPNVIANEALMVLKNNLVMANLVHRDYEKEFVKVGDTVTGTPSQQVCGQELYRRSGSPGAERRRRACKDGSSA